MSRLSKLKVGVIDVIPSPARTGGEIVMLNIIRALDENFNTAHYRFALNTTGSVLFYPFFPLCKPLSESLIRKVDVLFGPWSGAMPMAADMVYLQPPPVSPDDPQSLRSRLGIGMQTPRHLWPPPMMWLYYNRLVRGLLDEAALRTLDGVGTILVTSHRLQEELQREFHRDSKVIPPCVDRTTFSMLKSAGSETERKRRVVTISRIVPEKRLETIVEIANALPGVDFVIAGRTGGRSKDYSHSLVRNNPARNVSLLESVDLRTKVDLLSTSRVFLNTSVNETYLLTVIEATLAGAYPIVHASGGPLDYLTPSHLFQDTSEAIGKIEEALATEATVEPTLMASINSIADPARFDRDIVEATEEAHLARRR